MPAGVELRRAEPGDAHAIAEIWHLGWRDGHLDSASPELVAARTRASFDDRARDRVPDTTVAVVDGAIAGFVVVHDDEVEQVYVARDHRSHGVANRLMEAAEGAVRDAGYPTAWLAVVATNTRARRFYERCGWRDSGEFEYDAAGERAPIVVRAHRYVKALS